MKDDIGALIRDVNDYLEDIQDGRAKALERLYGVTCGKLLTMAKRYLCDKSLAEDVVSEVYLSVVKNIKSYKAGGNGLNWMYKITKNTALNMNRKGQKEEPCLEEISDIAVAFTIDGDENLERIALKEALLKLTESERKLLYLRFWEGLTIREIAKELKAPVMTTHYSIKRVLKKLEELL